MKATFVDNTKVRDKSYADQCLERAEKATPGPYWYIRGKEDVGELARRLKRACEALRIHRVLSPVSSVLDLPKLLLADELERDPEEK